MFDLDKEKVALDEDEITWERRWGSNEVHCLDALFCECGAHCLVIIR